MNKLIQTILLMLILIASTITVTAQVTPRSFEPQVFEETGILQQTIGVSDIPEIIYKDGTISMKVRVKFIRSSIKSGLQIMAYDPTSGQSRQIALMTGGKPHDRGDEVTFGISAVRTDELEAGGWCDEDVIILVNHYTCNDAVACTKDTLVDATFGGSSPWTNEGYTTGARDTSFFFCDESQSCPARIEGYRCDVFSGENVIVQETQLWSGSSCDIVDTVIETCAKDCENAVCTAGCDTQVDVVCRGNQVIQRTISDATNCEAREDVLKTCENTCDQGKCVGSIPPVPPVCGDGYCAISLGESIATCEPDCQIIDCTEGRSKTETCADGTPVIVNCINNNWVRQETCPEDQSVSGITLLIAGGVLVLAVIFILTLRRRKK